MGHEFLGENIYIVPLWSRVLIMTSPLSFKATTNEACLVYSGNKFKFRIAFFTSLSCDFYMFNFSKTYCLLP